METGDVWSVSTQWDKYIRCPNKHDAYEYIGSYIIIQIVLEAHKTGSVSKYALVDTQSSLAQANDRLPHYDNV